MDSEIYTYRNALKDYPASDRKLAGKRIVIQPNMSVGGWITDAGSVALEGFIAIDDAAVIKRLKDAGAILTGSSRMSELGFGLSGDTGAHTLSRGEADIVLITDTMGESRIAASLSGFYGFKPSFGIVSRSGLIGLVPSMECYGILAKNHSDIVDVLEIIAGNDENDFSMPEDAAPDFASAVFLQDKRFTAGVIRESLDFMSDREIKAFRAGLAKFEEAGIKIKEVSLERFPLFRSVHNVIASVEASSSAGKYDGVRYGHRCDSAKNWNEMYLLSRGESFGTFIKSFLFQGAYFQFENYFAFENACRIRRRLLGDVVSLFDSVDMLALPTKRLQHDALRAATVKDAYDAFLMTLPANVTGQPAIQIPSLATDAEADTGLQLVAPRLNDALLLSVAEKIAFATKGVKQHEV